MIVWSALLGDFADSLSSGQEVLMAITALLSGVLIWIAVRALILQQRFLARQENMEALEESRAFITGTDGQSPGSCLAEDARPPVPGGESDVGTVQPGETGVDRSLAGSSAGTHRSGAV